jgi:hypothetical protein
VHGSAFAGAAKLLTNTSQVPESLERWLSKPACKPITGVPELPASNTNTEQQKQKRGALIGRKFPWEENYDEMANA